MTTRGSLLDAGEDGIERFTAETLQAPGGMSPITDQNVEVAKNLLELSAQINYYTGKRRAALVFHSQLLLI